MKQLVIGLAYLPHRNESYLGAFDRSGGELAEVRPRGGYFSVRLDGRANELLFDKADPRTTMFDVWRLELDRGVETRLTFGPGSNVSARLDADGHMVYSAARGQAPRLYRRNLASGTDEPLEPEYPGMQTAADLSPDGQWLVYSQRSARGNFDLHALSLADRTVVPLRNSPADESGGRFSPDGKWIAYTSDETGEHEVYVMGFPAPGAPRALSAGGGRVPRWSADGRELLYIASTGQIMSVPVRPGSSLEIGRASVLFAPPSRFPWADFDVTPDGRFIAVVPLQYAAEQPLTVIVDWPALTKSRQ